MQANPLSSKFLVKPHAGELADLAWMGMALQQAEQAAAAGEVPIGAVLVLNGQAIASAHNSPISTHNACAHAEMQVIQQACRAVGNYRLGAKATLYVTLQPCLMCLGALLHARIGRVVIGCAQSRFNGNLTDTLRLVEQSEAWHPCAFETGCRADECEAVLTGFFKAHRKQREQTVRELANLLSLPNANKDTLHVLAQLGYHSPEDFLNKGLEAAANELADRGRALKAQQLFQQAAILASLCDYFKGEPVRSWKQYL